MQALATKMFLENPWQRPMEVCLPETSLSLVLFFFLVDLFVCGLMMIHGDRGVPPEPGSTVPLNLISEGEFDRVARCMAAAGVRCHLRVEAREGGARLPPLFNMDELARGPADLPLHEYVLLVADEVAEYRLWFELFHYTGAGRSDCHAR